MTSPTSAFRPRCGFAVLGALALLGSVCVAPSAQAQAADKKVTLNLKDAPVTMVLQQLFKSAGKNYTIDPNVTGTVTVDLTGVSFDTALNAVLQSPLPPLQAPQDTPGIYHVELAATPATQTPVNAPPATNDTTTADTSTSSDPRHPYLIRMKHYDAYQMALLIAAFSQKTATYVDPTGGQYAAANSAGGGGGGFGGGGGGRGGGGFGGGMGGMGGGGMGGFGGGGRGGFGGGGIGGGGFGGGGYGGGLP